MPRNIYISHGSDSEKILYEDLIIESIKIYGHDVYYLPREIVELDKIMNDDVISKFNKNHVVEMYLESIDGFEGDGKLITKFGLEIRDQITLMVSRRRWNQMVGRFGEPDPKIRPVEGDLIYMPLVRGLYEIKYVDDKKPFFQLNNLPVYKIVCELFEYANQHFDTGIDTIDDIQGYSSAGFAVTVEFGAAVFFNPNEELTITALSAVADVELLRISDVDGQPLQKKLFISPLTWRDGKFRVIGVGATVTSNISGATATVLSVETVLNSPDDSLFANDDAAQNNSFETEGGSFIDFSELNPFGEGSIS